MRVGINLLSLEQGFSGANRVFQVLLNGMPEDESIEIVPYVPRSHEAASTLSLSKRVRTYPVSVPTRLAPLRVASEMLAWPYLTRRDDLDVFHQTRPPVPRATGAPVLFTVHDLRYLDYPSTYAPLRMRFLRWAVPQAVRRSDKIHTVSEFTKSAIVKAYDVDPDKVVVIYNPVNPIFKRLDQELVARRLHGAGFPQEFILFVGHLEPRKNVVRLVLAYNKLVQRGIGEHLVIVGRKAADYERTLETIRECGIEDRVHLVHDASDETLVAAYNHASVFVLPSIHEGFGMPCVEAMACGAPVVAARSTAIPEVVGEAGALFDPIDVDDMADTLQRVLESDERRETFVRRGYERADLFGTDEFVHAFVGLYRSFNQAS